jgi:hypothetical protein
MIALKQITVVAIGLVLATATFAFTWPMPWFNELTIFSADIMLVRWTTITREDHAGRQQWNPSGRPSVSFGWDSGASPGICLNDLGVVYMSVRRDHPFRLNELGMKTS